MSSHSRHDYPISGLRGRYAMAKLQKNIILVNRFLTMRVINLKPFFPKHIL